MSIPASSCLRMTSSTPRRMASSNAGPGCTSPRSSANKRSATSCGRGRLPTCVVRIRSVLSLMGSRFGRKLLFLGPFAFGVVLQVALPFHASVFHLLVVRLGVPNEIERDLPGPCVDLLVVERGFVMDGVGIHRRVALHHVQRVAMEIGGHVEPRLLHLVGD